MFTKASPGIKYDTVQDTKSPPRISFSKYDEIQRRLHICSHLPKKSGENITPQAV